MNVVLTGVEEGAGSALGRSYTLAQNYPNPFNASTVIEYIVCQCGDVSLKIYNLLGQEVRVSTVPFTRRYTVHFGRGVAAPRECISTGCRPGVHLHRYR